MNTYEIIEIINHLRMVLTEFVLPLGGIAIAGVVITKVFQARYRSKHLRYFDDRLERLERKVDVLLDATGKAPRLEERLRVLEDIVVKNEPSNE